MLVLIAFVAMVAVGCSVGNPLSGDDPIQDGTTSTTSPDAAETAEDPDDGTAAGEESGSTDQPESETSPDEAAPTDPLIEPDAVTVQQVNDLPGKLAIGSGRRLVIGETDGTEVRVLDEGDDSVASQPTWSADGSRLIWSRVGDDGHEVVVSEPAGEGDGGESDEAESDEAEGVGGDVVTALAGSPAFYFQWSADGTTVAYLRNSADGRGVELGLIDPGEATATIGSTAPFFVAWAPEGSSSIAAHIGGTQLVELVEPRLAFDDEIVAPSMLLGATGAFSTPSWIDDRTVLAADSSGLILIDVQTLQTETVVSFQGAGRQVRFVVSPDRTKVAYQLVRGDGAPSVAALPGDRADDSELGPADGDVVAVSSPVVPRSATTVDAESGLVVVDLARETSEVVTLADVLRWEWSPTSDRLAWMEPIPSPVDRLARWNFWTDPDAAVVSTPIHHVPEVVAQAYLPFFEQYAHSVTGWSPDGSAFAFAGRHQAEASGAPDSIWVQLVVGDTPPVKVAEGDVVAWSP